jgi:hypothetical protein
VHIDARHSHLTKKIELDGPKTGTVGSPPIYNVKAMECDSEGNCKPVSAGTSVSIDIVTSNQPSRLYNGSTNTEGIAQIPILFQTAGDYQLTAWLFESGGTGGYRSDSYYVSITDKPTNGGGSGDGSASKTNTTTNVTALSLEDAGSGESNITGALWWVLGIGATILIAVIAAVFFLRRGGSDENGDEWDADDEY